MYVSSVQNRLLALGRLAVIVVAGSAVAMLGLLLFRAVMPLDSLRAASNGMGNYLQTLGGIYAVLLAFVVTTVWQQFDVARGHVDREAAALVDLHRTASGLPPTTRDLIQQGLRAYTEAVLNDEWPAMARRDEEAMTRVGERLDEVWLAIHRCQTVNDCQNTIYGEVLSRFNDLTDVRTSRLTTSRQRIPMPMRVLLFAGAVILIVSTYMMIFDPLWIHLAVVGAMSGAVVHILYLIVDLDDPFAGRYVLGKAPYERARTAFERSAHLVDSDHVAAA
ncbi:hypothetical protein BH11MYX2_BH11MYX2_40480 [soil metagenome]